MDFISSQCGQFWRLPFLDGRERGTKLGWPTGSALVSRRSTPLLAPFDLSHMTKKVFAAGMDFQPISEHVAQKWSERNPATRSLTSNSFLLSDRDHAGFEVYVRNQNANNLASPGTRMRRKAEYGIDPRMCCRSLYVHQQLANLFGVEIKGVPQHIRIATCFDLPQDLISGHERRLLLSFGIAKPPIWKITFGQLERPTPIPNGSHRGKFLADGHRSDIVLGPSIHIVLKT
jgi:hypothetical protein